MTTKHTPGPWNVSANDGFSVGINAENESCFDLATIHNGGDDKETIANARLISAAPDLLAALKGMMASPVGDYEAAKAARSAIAKAEAA